MATRWQWSTRAARRDMVRPLGGSDPAAHLTGAPEWDGARPRPVATRAPAMSSPMLDAAPTYDGRRAAARPGGTDGVAAERVGDDAPDRNRPAGQSATGLHSRDIGDGFSRLSRPPEGTDGTTYETELRIVEPEISAGSRAALTRGKNSLPENNPDGYRFGARVFRWTNRRMYRPRIVHEDRPAPIRTAKIPNQSPPLANGSRTSSPYSWNTRGRGRTLGAAPLVRRQPPTADYATLSDDPVWTSPAAQFVSL